jgi:hypothetical protein
MGITKRDKKFKKILQFTNLERICGFHIVQNPHLYILYSKIIKKNDGATINNGMCMIVSQDASGNVDNWLKYGNATANWRVLGVYSVNGNLYAKMITSDVVE